MNFLSNWLAKITKGGDEEGSFPIQQFEMNERVGDAYIASPYGVHANLPENQPALNISPDGTILMGIDPVGRIKVEAGEVVFYHPITKSKIHFKNNKDIDIESETDINAQCKNINANVSENIIATVDGDIDATVGGDLNAAVTGDIVASCVNLNATATTKVTVTAPNTELNGDMKINGNLEVTGTIKGAGVTDTITNVTLNSHLTPALGVSPTPGT